MAGHSVTVRSLIGQYYSFALILKTALFAQPTLIVLAISPLVAHVIWTRKNKYYRLIVGGLISIVVVCTATLMQSVRSTDLSQLLDAFAILRVAALILALGALLSLPQKLPLQVWALFICIVFGPPIMSAGTNNPWIWQFAFYTGLAVCIMTTAVVFCPLPYQGFYLPATGAILLLTSIGFYSAIENHPYRLGGRLSEASTPVKYGPIQHPMRAPEALAASFLALGNIHLLREEGEIPIIIDLTGRAPGVGLYLGLRPPKSAWILSGYPGSDAYLNFALSRLTVTELAQAWILAPAPASKDYQGLSQNLLNSYLKTGFDVSFPANYTAITKIPIAYMELTAVLYKPRN